MTDDLRTKEVEFSNKDFTLRFKLGDGPAQVVDGYGGWEEITRPRNTPITVWGGPGARRMAIPIVIDQLRTGRSIEKRVRKLLELGRTGDGDEEPPVFKVHGAAVPIKGRGMRWVLEATPTFGDTIRNRNGRLVRQFATLVVMEYEKGDRIKIKRTRSAGRRRYTTKRGDTINKIANKVYDKREKKKAKEIAELNKIRDRNKKLKPGTKIKLP